MTKVKAKKLKDHYDKKCAIFIADRLKAVHPKFDHLKFISTATKSLKSLEFLDRQDHFALALEDQYEGRYSLALKHFTKILGPELKSDTGMFIHGWWLWPIGRYVDRNAVNHIEHFDETMDFIEQLTKRFTGEFVIRPLLRAKPKAVINRVTRWSLDPNVHVRRLASEGLRPRLPWAKKSTVFLEHFEACSRVLTNLSEAQEKFVQRSVGNCLNDLYKEDFDRTQALVDRWIKKHNKSLKSSHLKQRVSCELRPNSNIELLAKESEHFRRLPKSTGWIIRHGQRSLRKKALRFGSAASLIEG